ncbi:PfkB family carbohydrate kinase [Intrasporangium sp.]|uniref:carbohydrate kinase family protein n=1 Tax=Intrasporangium sp. TaxID=1925024 RepID=UPI0032221200
MMSHQSFDPLAALRTAGAPEFDVFVHGTVFLDVIFAGMPAPAPGTEVWAEGMASCPGGIANLAVAARRLGLRTALAAAFSDDDYGDFCWRTLQQQEGVDLGRSRRFPDWHSPVTVSMSYGGDRTMVSHGHDAPVSIDELIGVPPRARAVFVDLADLGRGPDGPAWVELARGEGALCFADVGWDPRQEWSSAVLDRLEHCYAFMPNAVEAMAYTGTSSALDALYRIADFVPLAIVTNGAQGAVGIDGATGEEASVPALRVTGLDPTGSGDVFAAAMVLGTLAGWSLVDRMSFASLCSALALQQFGGSLAAPGWGDVVDWWHALLGDRSTDSYHRSLRRRYAFLEEIAPHVPVTACRRATATIARRADLPT